MHTPAKSMMKIYLMQASSCYNNSTVTLLLITPLFRALNFTHLLPWMISVQHFDKVYAQRLKEKRCVREIFCF